MKQITRVVTDVVEERQCVPRAFEKLRGPVYGDCEGMKIQLVRMLRASTAEDEDFDDRDEPPPYRNLLETEKTGTWKQEVKI